MSEQLKSTYSRLVSSLFLIVLLGVSLKMFLQLGSTIPLVSKLAFGFRPIVIAYLHLVLLLIITLFLLAFLYGHGFLTRKTITIRAIWVIAAFIILNELVLAIQGIYSFSYTIIPYANVVLFGITVVLAGSTALLTFSQWRNSKID